MKITTKEILLWQVLRDKIKRLSEGIAGQERIIQLHIQMDYRHNRKSGDYSKLREAIYRMEVKKSTLLMKFNKIDEKIEAYAELI